MRCRRANRRPRGAVLDKGKSAPVRFLLADSGCAQSCVPSGNRSLCFDSTEADSG